MYSKTFVSLSRVEFKSTIWEIDKTILKKGQYQKPSNILIARPGNPRLPENQAFLPKSDFCDGIFLSNMNLTICGFVNNYINNSYLRNRVSHPTSAPNRSLERRDLGS
jgi:hypothetical protein